MEKLNGETGSDNLAVSAPSPDQITKCPTMPCEGYYGEGTWEMLAEQVYQVNVPRGFGYRDERDV